MSESRPQETIRGVKKSDSNTGIIYIDSKGDLETQNRFPSPPFNISHDDDFHLTIVHETSRNDDNALDHEPPIVKETPIKNSYPDTLESVFKSTIIQSKFPTRSFSFPCSTSASECMNTITTPKKQQIPQNNSPATGLADDGLWGSNAPEMNRLFCRVKTFASILEAFSLEMVTREKGGFFFEWIRVKDNGNNKEKLHFEGIMWKQNKQG
ncbi:unnamed protein product [Lactuca saligna]|uniref:Uncharacterized protein n=1 Tax=Lactuca saligna TaxID=75948 RepID=A0AA35ZW60_LACSI|nr:unnamed protein product [Lactuca saligna]